METKFVKFHFSFPIMSQVVSVLPPLPFRISAAKGSVATVLDDNESFLDHVWITSDPKFHEAFHAFWKAITQLGDSSIPKGFVAFYPSIKSGGVTRSIACEAKVGLDHFATAQFEGAMLEFVDVTTWDMDVFLLWFKPLLKREVLVLPDQHIFNTFAWACLKGLSNYLGQLVHESFDESSDPVVVTNTSSSSSSATPATDTKKRKPETQAPDSAQPKSTEKKAKAQPATKPKTSNLPPVKSKPKPKPNLKAKIMAKPTSEEDSENMLFFSEEED